MHDLQLRDNPPEPREPGAVFVNTYDMQDHRHSKTQPENLGFIERMRALTDQYEGRAMVGEVGEGRRAIEVMADYTRGDGRLHMAYSFDMLGPSFSAEHFRSRIGNFFEGNANAWPCWSFSNHDVNRHVTRWSEHGASQDDLSELSAALLMGFEGTLGIYQGDELGLTETELSYDELTDPPGLRFWPMNKGRDGCRTPMVWDAEQTAAGFSDTDKTWLPVKAPQAERSVAQQAAGNDSTLQKWRTLIAFRKSQPALIDGKTTFADLPEPLLAFTRTRPESGDVLACVYNLSPEPQRLRVSGGTQIGPSAQADRLGDELSLGPNGFAYFEGSTSKPITITAGEH
jgi:alpha-glucosidase